MLEIAQESFHLVLNVEVLQVVHSLSLYASARNRVVIEVLGGRETRFFGGNAFLFNTKSGIISLALCPNVKTLSGRKH